MILLSRPARRRHVRGSRAALLLATLGLSLAAAPSALATTTVDFESPAIADGTVVKTQFAATKSVSFVTGSPTGATGFPISHVGSDARGGTHALNVSTNAQEFPTPDFAGSFSTTRHTVSLYARSLDGTASTSLTAYAAGSTTAIATDTHSVTSTGWTQFTVTAPTDASTIAYFRLRSTANATLLVDDLSYDDPVSPPPADFAIEAGDPVISLAAGVTRQIPITIRRINGSTGPITLSSVGSARVTFSQNPVPTGVTTVTASVTPLDNPNQTPVSIQGTPQDAAVGPAPRAALLTILVGYPVKVSTLLDPGVPELAPCTSAVRTFQFRRADGVTTPINVTTSPTLPGISISLDPAVVPSSAYTTDVTISRGDDTIAPGRRSFGLTALAQDFTLADGAQVNVDRVDPTFTSAATRAGAWTGNAPSALGDGDLVTISGSGLCPGSVAQFGSPLAQSPITVSADGTTATARVPRQAVDGPITIVTPAGRQIVSPEPFKVVTYRNSNGFAFINTDYQGGIDNWARLYGVESFMVSVDPCSWFGGHCPIPTGLPNPLSFILFGIADPILVGGRGSCFGFALASRRIANGQGPGPSSFGGGSTVWSIPDGRGIKQYIWTQHVAQMSSEYLAEWWKQSAGGSLGLSSAADLSNRVAESLRRGSRPLVSLSSGGKGHAINAYDITDRTAGGGFTIRVYNNNAPFTTAENSTDPAPFTTADDRSKIVVTPDGRWTFPEQGWTGGLANISVIDERAIPVRPTMLTSPDGLAVLVFGSGAPTAEASRAIGVASRASVGERAQAVDQSKRIASYTLLDDPNPKPILVTQEGTAHDIPVQPAADGSLNTLVSGGGKAAQVTAAGLKGASSIQSGAKVGDLGLTFAKASKASLQIAGTPASGVTGSMTAAFSGSLTGGVGATTSGGSYALTSSGTGTLRLSLSAAGAATGPSSFQGIAIPISGRSTVSVKPNWRHPDAPLRVTIRSGGNSRTLTVKNTARPAARVSGVKVSATRSGGAVTVKVRARIRGAAATATGTIGVAIKRGGKVVVATGATATGPALSTATLTLKLPAGAKGPWDVRAAVTTVGSATAPSTSSTGRGKTRLK